MTTVPGFGLDPAHTLLAYGNVASCCRRIRTIRRDQYIHAARPGSYIRILDAFLIHTSSILPSDAHKAHRYGPLDHVLRIIEFPNHAKRRTLPRFLSPCPMSRAVCWYHPVSCCDTPHRRVEQAHRHSDVGQRRKDLMRSSTARAIQSITGSSGTSYGCLESQTRSA